MPSAFLKQRFSTFLKEVGGTSTVQYVALDPTAKDADTGDIDESLAYAAIPIPLPALIDFSPSRAMREKIGLEISFDATLILATEHLQDNEITLKIGDAFMLLGDSSKFYLKRIVDQYQAANTFLGCLLAVSRRVGRR